jgi:hypothetical protein
MSWKPEVDTGDGVWTGNALRFATEEEAKAYVADLYSRWMSVRATRAVKCDLPVNYKWDGRLVHIKVDPTEAEIERSQARLASILGEDNV